MNCFFYVFSIVFKWELCLQPGHWYNRLTAGDQTQWQHIVCRKLHTHTHAYPMWSYKEVCWMELLGLSCKQWCGKGHTHTRTHTHTHTHIQTEKHSLLETEYVCARVFSFPCTCRWWKKQTPITTHTKTHLQQRGECDNLIMWYCVLIKIKLSRFKCLLLPILIQMICFKLSGTLFMRCLIDRPSPCVSLSSQLSSFWSIFSITCTLEASVFPPSMTRFQSREVISCIDIYEKTSQPQLLR